MRSIAIYVTQIPGGDVVCYLTFESWADADHEVEVKMKENVMSHRTKRWSIKAVVSANRATELSEQ